MKACVLENKNVITYKNINTPEIHSGEVLIKVKACGICSSDFNRVYGDSAYFYPLVLGHEFSGEIIKCAEDVDSSYIGKHVTVFPLLPCKECEFCKKKQYAQCKNYKYFGSRNNGAMAEYIAVPLWNIKVLPNSLDFAVAALTEPTAVAYHAIHKISDCNKKSICISGTGIIGILCGIMAINKGADVTFILRSNRKQAILSKLGFKHFIADAVGEYDIVLECVGTQESITNCLNLVKAKGEVILVGNPAGDLTLEKKLYWKLLRAEITVKGIWNSEFKNAEFDDWDGAIEFLNNNQTIVKQLITHKFKFEECAIAFECLKKSETLKVKGVFIGEE